MDNLREHQLLAVKALDFVAGLCDKHDIPYFLLAGSCLGAVRHKGFIPWDDDIDIGIINDDYEAFEKIIVAVIPKEFQWISNDVNGEYPRFYGKVLDSSGIALIDVFRLVKLPDDHRKRKSLWNTRKILYKIYSRKFNRSFPGEESMFNYIISWILSRFVSVNKIVQLSRNNEVRFKNSPSRDYINLYSIYTMEKETIKGEWVEMYSLVEFEGKKYRTVKDTDDYLSHLYGDYMRIPDDADKKCKHISVVFGEKK